MQQLSSDYAVEILQELIRRVEYEVDLTNFTIRMERGPELPHSRRTGLPQYLHDICLWAAPRETLCVAKEMIENLPTRLAHFLTREYEFNYTSVQIRPANAKESEMVQETRLRGMTDTDEIMSWIQHLQHRARRIYPDRVLNLALLDVRRPGWENGPRADPLPTWYARATRQTFPRTRPGHARDVPGSTAPQRPRPIIIDQLATRLSQTNTTRPNRYAIQTSSARGTPPLQSTENRMHQTTAGEKRQREPQPTPAEVIAQEGIPLAPPNTGLSPEQIEATAECTELYFWLKQQEQGQDEHKLRRVAALAAFLGQSDSSDSNSNLVNRAIKAENELPKATTSTQPPSTVVTAVKAATPGLTNELMRLALMSKPVREVLLLAMTPQ